MKIVFISNYLNHHQIELCNELYRNTEGQFTFIATREMGIERKKLGYPTFCPPIYWKCTYADKKQRRDCIRLIADADFVIIGSAPEWLLTQRKLSGKPIFRYEERPNKSLQKHGSFLKQYIKYHLKNLSAGCIYMLCASAYTMEDYSRYGLFDGRAYVWGYFPKFKEEADISALIAKKNCSSVLWVGRLISWKHPEVAVYTAAALRNLGVDFQMNIIGNGPMENELRCLAENSGVSDCVHFLGAMDADKVRDYMRQSEILLFISDDNEGWGCVLNEAMNSGCAVIACKAAGSVPYLIADGENGFVYDAGDSAAVLRYTVRLLNDHTLRETMGKAAYNTIAKHWNAKVAAERFCLLAERLHSRETNTELFRNGICSSACKTRTDG